MVLMYWILIIWVIAIIIFAIITYFKQSVKKKYFNKLKSDFENAWCDEQLLDIVYNTFQLKQKNKK
jgi:L-lactate permease